MSWKLAALAAAAVVTMVVSADTPASAAGPAVFANPGANRALNPQPLPPRVINNRFTNPYSTRALNPQPLPPRWRGSMRYVR